MIEFVLANWLLLLNIYLVGAILTAVVIYAAAGYFNTEYDDTFKTSAFWFINIFYIIGVFARYLKNKKG